MYGNDWQRVPISGFKKFLLLASFSIQSGTLVLSFFQEELNSQIAGEIYLNQLISSSKFDLHFPHTSFLYIHTRSFCSRLSFGPRGPSCAMLKSYKPVILFFIMFFEASSWIYGELLVHLSLANSEPWFVDVYTEKLGFPLQTNGCQGSFPC
jgi:hypothetical protein